MKLTSIVRLLEPCKQHVWRHWCQFNRTKCNFPMGNCDNFQCINCGWWMKETVVIKDVEKAQRKAYQHIEKDIQNSIIDWINAHKCGYAMRINSGAIPIHDDKGSRMIMLATKGTADIFFVWRGRGGFIEVKVPGKEPRPEQLNFLEFVKKKGAISFWVDNVDDAYKILEEIKQ